MRLPDPEGLLNRALPVPPATPAHLVSLVRPVIPVRLPALAALVCAQLLYRTDARIRMVCMNA